MGNFFKNKIVKSMIIITGGTAFAQILNIALSPIITRIFTPEDYGIYTTFTTLIGLLSIGALKYELAIPIEKDDKKASNLLVLSFLIIITFSLFITLILVFFKDFLILNENYIILYEMWYVLPIGIFLSGVYSIVNKWSYRIRDYKNISKTLINQSVFSNIFKITMGLLNFGPIGLVIGHIIGISAGINVLSKSIYIRKEELKKHIKTNELINVAKRYKNFPFYNVPSFLLMSLGSALPILFFSYQYGSDIVGLYGLAYTIVKLPMNVIGNSVAEVFYAEAANIGKRNPRKIKKLSINLLKKLILIGLLPLIILLSLGPELFSIVFGSEWHTSGEYSQILSVLVFFMLIFSPSLKIFIVFEKQKIKMFLDLLRVLLVIFSFGTVIYFEFEPTLAIILYTLAISIDFTLKYLTSVSILHNEIYKSENNEV